MKLGGVLVFAGWRLSDAVRHAELRGCRVLHAWPRGQDAFVEAEYSQAVADELAVDVVEGTIAIRSARGDFVGGSRGFDLSA